MADNNQSDAKVAAGKVRESTFTGGETIERGFKPSAPVDVARPQPVQVPEPSRPNSGNGSQGSEK